MKAIMMSIISVLLMSTTMAGFSGTIPVNQRDLLVVVDNSGSMHQSQERAILAARGFVERYRGEHLKIGVITTDEHHSELFYGRSIYGDFDLVMDSLFSDIRLAGVYGSGTEKHLEQVLRTFELSGENGFHRQGAKLSIVIITDEDNETLEGASFINRISQFKDISEIDLRLFVPQSCSVNGRQIDFRTSNLGVALIALGGSIVDLCLY